MAALCARLHIKHGITRWEGDKPASGVAAAARATRYRLLAEAAGSAGADIVLTGHTLDDQIETVAMRKLRGEGRGLAGMAPATLFEGRTWIARPLLGLRRERLRDFLRQNEVGWADDPTNVNIKYERPRVRAGLRSGAERGDLLPGIEVAQRRRIDLGKRAAVILRETATLAAPGLLRLDRKFDESADAEAAVYALRILLAASGGFEQLPDEERTAGLFRRLSGGTLRATLSRSVVDARKGGIYLRREARGLPPAMPVADGMVWDGRFRFRIAATTSPMTVAPHGAQNAGISVHFDAGVPQSLVRAALAAEPALWAEGECIGPAAGERARAAGVHSTPVAAPWARFLPSFDLAPARALAELLGCEAVPGLPFVGHNEGTMKDKL